ncbi:hypothetical protein O181_038546 [Austropuccinia psidii MF-1]|uniref:Uncharacterized protein n=1 Tax=Austropuccinia psidii MF-1 TaxID=1389203 RepID=A0A9Q3DE69_9BASI|nr:hypothetical protein [Austropuccinia psidii MF-1]
MVLNWSMDRGCFIDRSHPIFMDFILSFPPSLRIKVVETFSTELNHLPTLQDRVNSHKSHGLNQPFKKFFLLNQTSFKRQ